MSRRWCAAMWQPCAPAPTPERPLPGESGSGSPCTSSLGPIRAWKMFCRSARRRTRPPSRFRMILARVVGTIVATRKDPRLEGFKLLIVKPVAPDGKDESGYVIAVDTVSAGSKETVIVVSGSSARMAEGCKDKPVDASIVGIVDTVTLNK